MVGAMAAPSQAARPIVAQDGLVNVAVNGVNILNNNDVDINVGVAAGIAATVCGVDVGPLALAVLGQAVAVDNSGQTRTICETAAGPVTISQNN